MPHHDGATLPDGDFAVQVQAAQQARSITAATARRLRLMDALTAVILRHHSLDGLMQELIAHVQTIMDVDNVAILRLDPTGQALIMDTVRGPEEVVADRVRVPVGQGIAGRIYSTCQPMIVADLAHADVVNSFLSEHLRSLLGVPLVVDDRTLGVIHVSTVQVRHFTDDDVQMLQLVADRIALAIDRAKIIEAAQQARAEAEARAVQLAVLNERMDNFISIASHEMRTPLTTIIASLDLFQRRVARIDDEPTLATFAQTIAAASPLARRAREQASRLNRLVSDLLDASRIHTDRLDIRLATHDLRDIVREAVEEQLLITRHRDIRCHLPAQPVLATVDADRVGQVVTNYLTNALKFAPADYPIQVRLTGDEDTALVVVRDRGPGIRIEDQERIWERFQRVDTIEHQNGSYIGLGLGLSICQTIIARHHGQSGVRSQPNRGATFWFTLPLKADATSPMDDHSPL